MSNALKCPNPSCPYLFDPTGVSVGVVLTCPRCGMRFTLGPSTQSDVPANKPAPKMPQRPDPSFEALSQRPQSEPDNRSTRDQMLIDRGSTGGAMTAFWILFTFAVLLGVGVTVYFRAFHNPDNLPQDLATRLKNCNLAFDPPASPWVRDQDMEAKLGAPIQIVYKRTEPEAYIAVGAVPSDDREPRLSELKEGLNKPLGKLFSPDTLAVTKIEGGPTWLGLPANPAFSFIATLPDGSKSTGECHAVSYKGVAYWCLCWAGELEFARVVGEFDEIRGRFKILKDRENWQPKEASITSYGGRDFRYELRDADGIWTESAHPEQQVPPADLFLVGKIKRPGTDRMDRQPTAELWVYAIDNPGGDPLAAAQKYVEGVRTAEVKAAGERFTTGFDVLTGEPEGDSPADPVEQSSPVVRLKGSVKESRDQSRLIVVSATTIGNKLIVVRAQCDFKDREFFEAKLMQFAGSLRAGP